MSKQVDERIVSMQFDNRQFENNVKTSMGTLDKLKQSLKLTEASKGLENVSTAAKRFDISPLGNGVESVKMKFSALEVMAVTALANITNSAVNTGKRLVSAFTIDPIKSGFQEYETQINAVQTILANTSSKGTTIDQVNEALDTLNTYADKTIYNFTEMTRNIGTFTAAGIDLETSVSAIQGIANLAAVSGSTSQQASTAMYQLSQALASGTVKLMDWNSVVNAGMGGEVFQNALKKTSELLGTGAEAAIKANGSFRESLSTGWLTSEVLTETLKKFTTSGANEYVAEYCGISAEAVQSALDTAKAQYGEAEAVDKAAEALSKKTGKNKEEIKSALSMARTAEDAATKVKTFTQLFDTLKEAAQSGWTQSFEIIIGDFEEAKEMLTKLSDFFGGIINNISEARNRILEGAFGSPLGQIVKKVSKFKSVTTETTKSITDLGTVVDDVLNGKFGNGQERWDALTKAGYNWAEVQNEVNKKLGSSYQRVVEVAKAQEKQTEKTKSLTDAELRKLELTDEEIKLYRELEKQSEKTGKSIDELVNENKSGRDLLIESFANIGKGLITIFNSIGEAWNNIFGISEEQKILGIYNALQSLNNATAKFAKKFKENGEDAEKLRITFQGLFAALDLVRMVVGGGLNIAFKILNAVLSYFNMDILDLTAAIGQVLIDFRDWVKAHDLLGSAVKAIIPLILAAIEATAKWIESTHALEKSKKFISNFVESSVESIKKFIKNAKESGNIPKYIVTGLANGLINGSKTVAKAALKLAKSLYETVCEFLGIHSPSRKFIEIGGYIIEGLCKGIQNGIIKVKEIAVTLAESLTEVFEKVNGKQIFSMFMQAGTLVTLYKVADGLQSFGKVFKSTANLIDKCGNSLKKVLDSTSKAVDSFAFSMKASAIKNIAISLAILAGSITLLSFVDPKKLWNAVGVIAVLAVVLAALSFAMSKLSGTMVKFKKGEGLNVKTAVADILAIGLSLLALAGAIKIISTINPDDMKTGLLRMIEILTVLGIFFVVLIKASKNNKGAENAIAGIGTMAKKLAESLLIMVLVVKLASMLKPEEIDKAKKFMIPFGILVATLVAVSCFAEKDMDKIGKMASKLAMSMIVMVYAVKVMGQLKEPELKQGLAVMSIFFVFIDSVVLLSALLKKNLKNIDKLGKVITSVGVAMLAMAASVKIVGALKFTDFLQGMAAVVIFSGIIGVLLTIVRKMGNNGPKMASTITSVGIAIGILAGVTAMLGLLSIPTLLKGVVAVGVLSVIIGLLIKVSKEGGDCAKTVQSIAIAIGVLAASIALLSFIDETKLAAATLSMAVVMGMLALVIKSTKDIGKVMGAIIAMDVAIGLIAATLITLSLVDTKASLVAAASMSIVLLSLAGAMFIIGKVKVTKSTLATLGTMAATIIALGLILAIISGLPTSKAAVSIALLSVALLALAGTMLIISKLNVTPTTLVTLGLMVTTIVTLGLIMSMLSTMNVEGMKNIAYGLLMLVGTLAAIAIAVSFMTNCLPGAAALVIVTAALCIFIPVLMKLCELKYSEVAVGLIALGGALAVVGVAAALLSPYILVIMGLGVAISLIGAGVLLASAGLIAFGVALGIIIKDVYNFFSDAIKLATEFVEFVGTTILTIVDVLATGGTQIVKAIIDITVLLLQGLRDSIPLIVQVIGEMVVAAIYAIVDLLPSIIQAGIDFILNFIEGLGQGIEDNADRLREVMISFCVHLWKAFCSFFGIHSPSRKMAEAGVYLIEGLIKGIMSLFGSIGRVILQLGSKMLNGLLSTLGSFFKIGCNIVVYLAKGLWSFVTHPIKTIKNICKSLVSAVKGKVGGFIDAGVHLVKGLIKGLKSKAGDAVDAAKWLGGKIEKATRKVLGIFSPSRVFKKLGEYVVLGFAEGLKDKDGKVEKSSETLAKTAVNASSAISKSVPIYKMSSEAIAQYANNLYLLSDAYKSERDAVKESKESIEDLKKARAASREDLKKQFGSTQSLLDKQYELEELVEKYSKSNKEGSKERLAYYKKELEKVKEQINSFDSIAEAKAEIQRLSEANEKIDEQINSVNNANTSTYNDQYNAIGDINTALDDTGISIEDIDSLVGDVDDSFGDVTGSIDDVGLAEMDLADVAETVKDKITGFNDKLKESNIDLTSSISGITSAYENVKKVVEPIISGAFLQQTMDEIVNGTTTLTGDELNEKIKTLSEKAKGGKIDLSGGLSGILVGAVKATASATQQAANAAKNYKASTEESTTATEDATKANDDAASSVGDLSGATSSASKANTAALEAEKKANEEKINTLTAAVTADEDYQTKIDEETDKIRSNASYLEKNNRILDRQTKKRDEIKAKIKEESKVHKELLTTKAKLENEYSKALAGGTSADIARANAIKAKISATEQDIKASETRTNKLNTNLKKVREEIQKTKKYITKNEEELAKQTKEFYKELSDGIKENVTKYMDPLKMDYSSGVSSLFEEFNNEVKNMSDDSLRRNSESMIDAMQSQVDGVKNWKKDLDSLAGKLDEGLLAKLKELGPSAVKEIKAFTNMTDDELKKANELFKEEQDMSTESLLDNYRDSAKKATEWRKKMKTLSKMGFDESILQEIGEMDIDEGLKYMDVLSNMSKEQMAEFISLRDKTNSIAKKSSKDVIASYEYAGSEAADAYRKGIQTAADKKELKATCIEFGKKLASNAAKGMAKPVTEELSKGITKAIKTYTKNTGDESAKAFKMVGKYLASGFAKGISENSSLSNKAALKLAEDAYKAAMKKLDAHSPSKVFMKVGSYVPQGFAIGIDKFGKKVEDSAGNMADSAINVATNSLSTISDTVNNGLDANPRITPVIDMDASKVDVISLTAEISSLVMKPIDSIQSMIDKAQTEINASNDRVIAAIDGLREDIQSFCTTDDKELALYVDSKKMASALVNPMNRQLNVIARRQGGL